jgi:hypothetical protein
VIALGLRLAVAGGREAIGRLVTIAAAVALGCGLLLTTLAALNGVSTQNARYAWLNSGVPAAAGATQPGPAKADPMWWRLSEDYVAGRPMARVDVAATGPDSPVPPGIPALPGPGEFYASPALSADLASMPAAQLGDRFRGRQIGTIAAAALPAPDMLIVIVGHSPGELSHAAGASQVSRISTVTPSACFNCQVGTRADGMDLILSVVAGALLFPVLIFIGTATRLNAARREQRFAAIRLVGATPRQVSTIATVESTLAALAGTVLGFVVFFGLRHPLAAIPFTGQPFYPSDLSLNLIDTLAVVLGIPVGAAVAARLALRRVRISPLGVTRRVTPRPPRWYRLIPLLLGVAELLYWVVDVPGPLHHQLLKDGLGFLFPVAKPDTGIGQVEVFLPGFLVVMAGLVYAGPWLTMVGARLLARRSRRPATLIATRRLADNPQAAFRAVSGLVLGLFVTTVALGVITTIVFNRGGHAEDAAVNNSMTMSLFERGSHSLGTSVPADVAAALRATPGVAALTVVRHNPDDSPDAPPPSAPMLPGLVSCADLAKVPGYGQCQPGATVDQVTQDFSTQFLPISRVGGPPTGTVWLPSSVTADTLDRLPILSIVVATDGSTAAIERARTILELAYPGWWQAPTTQADSQADFTKTLNGWQQLADVVILASLPIAGCSLAVSVVGGMSERKRPFALLRLAGVPLRVLRRVVALESAVPLLVVAAVAIGTGLFAADLFLRAQMGYTVRPPGTEYYLTVAAGLVASLAIIASTLPLLERITGPETARND